MGAVVIRPANATRIIEPVPLFSFSACTYPRFHMCNAGLRDGTAERPEDRSIFSDLRRCCIGLRKGRNRVRNMGVPVRGPQTVWARVCLWGQRPRSARKTADLANRAALRSRIEQTRSNKIVAHSPPISDRCPPQRQVIDLPLNRSASAPLTRRRNRTGLPGCSGENSPEPPHKSFQRRTLQFLAWVAAVPPCKTSRTRHGMR